MSLSVTETLTVSDTVTEQLTIGGSTSSPQQQVNPSLTFTNGTGAGKIQWNWVKSAVVLAASGAVTYTLSALTDDLGRAIAFTKVRKLIINITTITDGDSLTLAPGTTHGWTGFLSGTTPVITFSGPLLIGTNAAAGYAVASGSNDQVTITNTGSHSITFTIGISGE